MSTVLDNVEARIDHALSAACPVVTLSRLEAFALLSVAKHLPKDAFWLAAKLREDSEALHTAGHPIRAGRILRAANAIERIGISIA